MLPPKPNYIHLKNSSHIWKLYRNSQIKPTQQPKNFTQKPLQLTSIIWSQIKSNVQPKAKYYLHYTVHYIYAYLFALLRAMWLRFKFYMNIFSTLPDEYFRGTNNDHFYEMVFIWVGTWNDLGSNWWNGTLHWTIFFCILRKLCFADASDTFFYFIRKSCFIREYGMKNCTWNLYTSSVKIKYFIYKKF